MQSTARKSKFLNVLNAIINLPDEYKVYNVSDKEPDELGVC